MPSLPDLLPAFQALPGAFLLLSPDFVIEAVSDAYLAATLTTRAELVGRFLFDAFPDNPAVPDARATHNLRASLALVRATGQPHEMARQRYDVPDPDRPGHFVERSWLPRNTPVLDTHGRVAQLLHTVVDVTAQVQDEARLRASQAREQAAQATAETQHQHWQDLLAQAPVAFALLEGPHYVVALANAAVCAMWGVTPAQALHTPLFELLPALAGQGIRELLDGVRTTGVPYVDPELRVELDRGGRREIGYFNFLYHPLRAAEGPITGVTIIATEVSEQVRARQHALAQQQLRTVFAQAPVAICVFRGPDYVLDVVNAGMLALWDRPWESLVSRPFFEALPELATQGLRELLDQVRASGEPVSGQAREVQLAHHPPGESHLYDFVYQPLLDAQGRVEAVTCVATDVSEQVRARQQVELLNEELQAANEELHATNEALVRSQHAELEAVQHRMRERETLYQMFAQTPAAVCIQHGPEHRYAYTNDAYQQLFPGRRLLGRAVAQALPETVAGGVVALLDHVYQTGETYYGTELPLLIAQPDGPPRQRYFTFTYQAYRENGEIVGITTFAFDVAEQVLARQQREAAQRQLHDLFMQAPAPIAILDGPELVYQLVNPAYQRIFPGRELLGKSLAVALPELRDSSVPGLLRQVYETGETYVAQEMRLQMARHEGGALADLYCTFTYQARRNAQHAVDGILVFVYDITDQVLARLSVEQNEQHARAMSEELAMANAQLTRTNVDLDNFIYTASHDLKAPIANIEGLLAAVQHELPAAGRVGEISNMLDLMQGAIERFGRTVGHLTDVARLQQEHSQPARELELARLVREVELDLTPLIQQANAQVEVAVPEAVRLTFSEKNLRSVVYNLLSNALKYRHPDRSPVIRLTYRLEETYQVLQVQDNGLGLDVAQSQGKLFGLFQRLHTHVEGTGIGLYMVKKMVENAGGRIEVSSQLGQGTTFSVYFPQ